MTQYARTSRINGKRILSQPKAVAKKSLIFTPKLPASPKMLKPKISAAANKKMMAMPRLVSGSKCQSIFGQFNLFCFFLRAIKFSLNTVKLYHFFSSSSICRAQNTIKQKNRILNPIFYHPGSELRHGAKQVVESKTLKAQRREIFPPANGRKALFISDTTGLPRFAAQSSDKPISSPLYKFNGIYGFCQRPKAVTINKFLMISMRLTLTTS